MDRKYLLKIGNYEYFIKCSTNAGTYYTSAHQILADLEKEIIFKQHPEKTILIPYKEWGDCIFIFDRIYREEGNVFIVYNYDTSVS